MDAVYDRTSVPRRCLMHWNIYASTKNRRLLDAELRWKVGSQTRRGLALAPPRFSWITGGTNVTQGGFFMYPKRLSYLSDSNFHAAVNTPVYRWLFWWSPVCPSRCCTALPGWSQEWSACRAGSGWWRCRSLTDPPDSLRKTICQRPCNNSWIGQSSLNNWYWIILCSECNVLFEIQSIYFNLTIHYIKIKTR